MHFVGIDLAWKVQPDPCSTGICVLDEEGQLIALELVTSDEEILQTILSHRDVWVGIDAPLKVPNLQGMRTCERELLRLGLRCLPSNQAFMDRKFGGRRGELLAGRFGAEGFSDARSTSARGRAYFEVYPFGALRLLLGRVPRYKKGSFIERRDAMMEAIKGLEEWDAPRPLVQRCRESALSARNSELKSVGDMLDAAISVTCVYAHWIYDGQRTQLVGEEGHGRVLLPAKREKDEKRGHRRGLPASGKAVRVR